MRRIGALGGRARGRNLQLRKVCPVPIARKLNRPREETTAEAIRRIASGLARKRRLKRSGASMPCARGWLVRSAARDGGGPAEGACGIHANVSCKENFAACVKKLMPLFWGPPITIAALIPMFSFVWSIKSGGCHRLGLTVKSMRSIIIFTHTSSYAQEQ